MTQTLAIISPIRNAYSETFIQAHKNLPFNIKFYYEGLLPSKLEYQENIFLFNFLEKIKIRLNKNFNLSEHALINSLRREKVDCVLAEYGTTAAATLKVISHLKLPLVVHFHGSDASLKEILNENKESYKNVFSYASKIIVVSKRMKSKLHDIGCPVDKLLLSYYGPNEQFLNCKPSYHNQQFISVGRFVEKKAPYLTILAFKKIIENYPFAKLIMVGEGILLPVCKQLVSALNLTNQIQFKGVQSTTQIQSLFEESIAFVQHSIVAENGDSEGTPVAILEAQAAALPVISTFHAGIPDVVANNETGLLVQEKDVEGMAKNMIRILNEAGLARGLGENGRKRIKEKFTSQQHLKQIEIAISQAISTAVNE